MYTCISQRIPQHELPMWMRRLGMALQATPIRLVLETQWYAIHVQASVDIIPTGALLYTHEFSVVVLGPSLVAHAIYVLPFLSSKPPWPLLTTTRIIDFRNQKCCNHVKLVFYLLFGLWSFPLWLFSFSLLIWLLHSEQLCYKCYSPNLIQTLVWSTRLSRPSLEISMVG